MNEKSAKLIAKFDEPNLERMEVLIAKSNNYESTAPDDQGWIIRTVAKNGKNPTWSAWSTIGEVELLNTILIGHLGISQEAAEALIEKVHADSLTVQERLTRRI